MELGEDPYARLSGAPEDGRLQSGEVRKARRGPGARLGQRRKEMKPSGQEARGPSTPKAAQGPPRVVAGTADDGEGLPFRTGGVGESCAHRSQMGSPPQRTPPAATAPGWGGRGSGAPSPGPRRGDPPSLQGAQPFLPAPGALTWKRFFTHSFFMAGEGAGRASGRGGDGRGRGGVGGGAGGDPGAGGSRRCWRKEPRGRRSPGAGKAAAPGACPSPASWRPTLRPLPCPAPLRPLGQLSPAHLRLAPASRALGTWGN